MLDYESFLNKTNKLPKCESLKVSVMKNQHGFVSTLFHLLRRCSTTRKLLVASYSPSYFLLISMQIKIFLISTFHHLLNDFNVISFFFFLVSFLVLFGKMNVLIWFYEVDWVNAYVNFEFVYSGARDDQFWGPNHMEIRLVNFSTQIWHLGIFESQLTYSKVTWHICPQKKSQLS